MLGPTLLSNILRPCNLRFKGLPVRLNHCFARSLFPWSSGNRWWVMCLIRKNRRYSRSLWKERKSLIGRIPVRAPSIMLWQERRALIQNKKYYRNSSLRNKGKLSSQNAIKIQHLLIIPSTTTRLRNPKWSTLPHFPNLGRKLMLKAKHMLPLFIDSSQPPWSLTNLQWLKWRWASQQRTDRWITQRCSSFPIIRTRDFTIKTLSHH